MRLSDNDRELLELTEELENLNLRRDQVVERIDAILVNQPLFSSDRDGTELQVGDTVSILTPGKYSFREGTVIRIGKQRVTIKSDHGSVTSRKSTNLRKLN